MKSLLFLGPSKNPQFLSYPVVPKGRKTHSLVPPSEKKRTGQGKKKKECKEKKEVKNTLTRKEEEEEREKREESSHPDVYEVDSENTLIRLSPSVTSLSPFGTEIFGDECIDWSVLDCEEGMAPTMEDEMRDYYF